MEPNEPTGVRTGGWTSPVGHWPRRGLGSDQVPGLHQLLVATAPGAEHRSQVCSPMPGALSPAPGVLSLVPGALLYVQVLCM